MNCYHDNPLISPYAFQEIIRERARERKEIAKEKCQEGLKQIREMKSRNGVHPLDMFPKEIWYHILQKLNPKDRGNARIVHPTFQNLLESSFIQEILFPQALKLVLDLIKNNDLEEDNMGDRKDIHGSEFFHFLGLRGVSKTTRRTFDDWFEEKIPAEFQNRESVPSGCGRVPSLVLYFHDEDRLNRLFENFSANTPNPAKIYFLRSIKVAISTVGSDIDHDDDQQDIRNEIFLPFKSKMLELLDLIGNQISYFKLWVDGCNYFAKVGITEADYYLFLQECCLRLPNLRRLDVEFEIEPWGWRSTRLDLQTFKDLILGHPFPKLEKLERISLEENRGMCDSIKMYEAMLMANPHVKMLRLMIEEIELYEKTTTDALKALNLEYFTWDDTNTSGADDMNIYDVPCRNWPLTTLVINPMSCNLTLSYLFNALNEFPLLQKLTLDIDFIEFESGNGFLMLPNLTHFDCRIGGVINWNTDDVNFFFSLQFLLHSKKLRRLVWRNGELQSVEKASNRNSNEYPKLVRYLKSHECPEKMIDFRSGMRDLKSSNIWNVFPELEMVEVEVDKRRGTRTERYTRPFPGVLKH